MVERDETGGPQEAGASAPSDPTAPSETDERPLSEHPLFQERARPPDTGPPPSAGDRPNDRPGARLPIDRSPIDGGPPTAAMPALDRPSTPRAPLDLPSSRAPGTARPSLDRPAPPRPSEERTASLPARAPAPAIPQTPMPPAPRAPTPPLPSTRAATPATPSARAPSPPTPAARPAVTVRRLRRGRLAIRKVDPWSVLKFSLVFYFCMLLIMLLGAAIIFATLKAFGIISDIERFSREQIGTEYTISGGTIFRWLFLLGLGGTVIASAITTFMAFLYNLIADVVGGIELLVTERE